MSDHPIQSLMENTLQKIREMADVNTIIGEQITSPDGTVIIPVSKVSMGFASGGSDVGAKSTKTMFGGGGGAGVTINPVAFIVISNGNVKLLQIENSTTASGKAVALVPELFDKITALFNKDKKEKQPDTVIHETTIKTED
ncbi:MAG TPA: GerW family sporulation protein [Ruminiclostridium sp.]|nr:GerW family sporulation protein [Ruminiclostridium sp.]